MAEAQSIHMAPPQASFKQATAAPARKVAVGGVAGAVVTVALFVLDRYFGTPVPGDVAASMTLLLTFAASYWVPPAPTDQLVGRE